MTNTSRRLRALASRLCVFDGFDMMTLALLESAMNNEMDEPWQYMHDVDFSSSLAMRPWRTTVQEELESIYADHQARQAD